MQNPLPGHINDLIIMTETQLKQPGTDKVAARRTRAALETAKYCAMGIFPGNNLQAATAPLNASNGMGVAGNATCVCPTGARDAKCPAH